MYLKMQVVPVKLVLVSEGKLVGTEEDRVHMEIWGGTRGA